MSQVHLLPARKERRIPHKLCSKMVSSPDDTTSLFKAITRASGPVRAQAVMMNLSGLGPGGVFCIAGNESPGHWSNSWIMKTQYHICTCFFRIHLKPQGMVYFSMPPQCTEVFSIINRSNSAYGHMVLCSSSLVMLLYLIVFLCHTNYASQGIMRKQWRQLNTNDRLLI